MEKVKFLQKPKFRQPSLLVGWEPDAGMLGTGVMAHLRQELGAEEFCRIDPSDYFSLGGVSIKADIIEFPTPLLYLSEQANLLLFQSMQPSQSRYEFLCLLLDLAQKFKVKRIYTIGGLATGIFHLERRRVLTVFNQPKLREELSPFSLNPLNYQGSPAMSSLLLWLAKKRRLSGSSFWGEVPFYLAEGEDSRMVEIMLASLCQILNLQIDLSRCQQKANEQERKIAQIREQNFHIDKYLGKTEKGLELSEEERNSLAREMENLLREL